MKIEIEESNHKVSGWALCADDTGRAIGSCYSESDAVRITEAFNLHNELVEQVELLTAQKVALIEYIKNPPQPSEETKRINEYWRGYNAN